MDKPKALKTDENGNCIMICRDGQLEYISRLIHGDNMSQREACQNFVDAVNAHIKDGDPIDKLTVEKVRSQYRRDSNQLKDKPKPWGRPTQDPADMSYEELIEEHEANDQQFDRFRERYNHVAREYCRRENKRIREEAAIKYKSHIPNWDELTPEQRYDVAQDLGTWRRKIKGYLEMTEEERVAAQEKWQKEKEQADQEAKERAEEAWRAWTTGLGIKEDEVEPSPEMVDFISKAFELVPADQKKAVAKDVYHAVSKRIHPDVGGGKEDMQKLTALYEELNNKL